MNESNKISIAAKDDEQMTDTEIERAHVIILVYDVNNLECIKGLRSFWIPRIIKINDRVSINLRVNLSLDPNHLSWQQS